MFSYSWKVAKHICMILTILLMLIGATNLVQARQVEAAPLTEGVKPALPEQVASMLVESISAGGYHTCGLKNDGSLACLGYNAFGQSAPQGGIFTWVSAGGYHTCVLKSDGTLACWGNNDDGQSMPPAGTFTQVSAGYLHTCGLKSDGTLTCWGDNPCGQSNPPSGTFTQVSAGWCQTCGLKSDGTLTCWGDNYWGQSTPPSGTFTQVGTGYIHTCGLKSDGSLVCWGGNGEGQSTPPSGTFTQVSVGYWHNCGLKSDGSLACWGYNEWGQSTPPSGTFTQVSAGYGHTCGLKSDGSLACWGWNDYGQSTPPGGTFAQVSAGLYHTCGLKSDGTLICWGDNGHGQSNPFTISGNVGIGGVGATLSYTDGFDKTVTADGNGNYSLAVSYNWSGTVTPSKTGFTFTPASRTYANVQKAKTGQNFTVTFVSISGNAGAPGVTMSYTDGTPKTATADGSGNYTLWVSYNWSGTVTPSKTGYTFSPASLTYTNVQSPQTGQNYTALVSISGNAGVGGAILSYMNGTPKTATADGSGNYSFMVPYNWSGTVMPYKTGFIFTPVSRTYTNIQSTKTDQGYIARPTISGNTGAPGVTMSYTDGKPKIAIADASGNYLLVVSYNWSGTVTPSKTGYTFSPAGRTYNNVQSPQTDQNFTVAFVSISGNVGVGGATLIYTNGTLPPKRITADGSGNYTLWVSYNWSGTVTPSKTGFTFTPASRTYTNVQSAKTGQGYIAHAATPAAWGG